MTIHKVKMCGCGHEASWHAENGTGPCTYGHDHPFKGCTCEGFGRRRHPVPSDDPAPKAKVPWMEKRLKEIGNQLDVLERDFARGIKAVRTNVDMLFSNFDPVARMKEVRDTLKYQLDRVNKYVASAEAAQKEARNGGSQRVPRVQEESKDE
jgi:hypothetical protein